MKFLKYSSEEALLQGLQAGDRQALATVYATYWPMIANFVRLNQGSEQEAEDLYQEGMITLYEQVRKGNFRMSSSIKTYLYSICRNKWLTHLRSYRKVTDIEEYQDSMAEEATEKPLPLPNEPEIKAAIEALGEPCRSLLLGFYYHQFSLDQLADQLNYTGANVAKQQKFRCVERLKKRFLTQKN